VEAQQWLERVHTCVPVARLPMVRARLGDGLQYRLLGQKSQPRARQGVEVVLLRNLSGVGVGLFAAEGFYPNFMLWLKRGDAQALAFVEPKGLRHQGPQDKFDLLEKVVPTWAFSVPVRGFVLSGNSEAELRKIQPNFSWASAPAAMLHQDPEGAYVERLLQKLDALMPAAP
jgi:hypothetical protein